MTTNRYGLKRSSLNAATRREIRQKSGFGCVICGLAIGEFDHVIPEFANARAHTASGMTFLCHQHHGKVTRGQLSRQTVIDAMESPYALKNGFSFEAFDLGNTPPKIHLGPVTAINCDSIIRVNGKPIFWIRNPENEGEPFLFNAEFRNSLGEVILRIIDNEWQVRKENWDVEVVGSKITLRHGPRDIALILRSEPPNSLFVERMDIQSTEGRIICNEKEFRVIRQNQDEAINASHVDFEGFQSAIDINSDQILIGTGGGKIELKKGASMMFGNFGQASSKVPNTKKRQPIYNQKTPRNAKCPCGSLIKFKKCCGRQY